MKYYVFLPDMATVMELYNLIKAENIKATLAPTPREASHCCGVAILYDNGEDKKRIKEIVEENNIAIDDFWQCENKDDPNRMKFC